VQPVRLPRSCTDGDHHRGRFARREGTMTTSKTRSALAVVALLLAPVAAMAQATTTTNFTGNTTTGSTTVTTPIFNAA